jgi:hypothetical protein
MATALAIEIDRIEKKRPVLRVITASVQLLSSKPFDLLTITNERKKSERYRLMEVASGDTHSRAFALTKIDESVYHVMCHESDDAQCHCDCIGGMKSGWCKHIVAIRALMDHDELVADRRDRCEAAIAEAKKEPQPRCVECDAPLPDAFEATCQQCQVYIRQQLERTKGLAATRVDTATLVQGEGR